MNTFEVMYFSQFCFDPSSGVKTDLSKAYLRIKNKQAIVILMNVVKQMPFLYSHANWTF